MNGQSAEDVQKMPPAVIEQAKQILRDYDTQIRQLSREMQELQKELAEFEGDKR